MSQDQHLLEQLLSDDHFIEWVLHPTPENDLYWTSWAYDHPAQAAVLEEARHLILLVKLQPSTPAEQAAAEVWDRIGAALQHADVPAPAAMPALAGEEAGGRMGWFSHTRRIAASLALAVLMAAMVYLSLPPRSFQDLAAGVQTRVSPYGQQSSFMLPDGSKVFLNAGSSLQYPSNFEGQPQRLVHLQGEAFFEVVQDKHRSFVVKTRGLDVKVLGTRFNVKAYGEEELVETTLVEGKVELNPQGPAAGWPAARPPIALAPNQKADFSTRNGKVALASVNPQFYTSWTEGKLLFRDMPLSEVVRVLNRAYDVRIRIADKKLARCSLTADLTQLPLARTLEIMCLLVEARFSQNGKQILITGKGC